VEKKNNRKNTSRTQKVGWHRWTLKLIVNAEMMMGSHALHSVSIRDVCQMNKSKLMFYGSVPPQMFCCDFWLKVIARVT